MARTTRKGAATALLLHGEERFLVDEKARRTVEGWRSELVSDFGLETMEGAGLAPARLQDAVLQAPFTPGDVDQAGNCRYRFELQPPWAGTLEYEVRAVPDHPHLSHPYELGLMRRL